MRTLILSSLLLISFSVFSASFEKVVKFKSNVLKSIEQSQVKVSNSFYNDGYYSTQFKVKITSRKNTEYILNSIKQLVFILNQDYSMPEFLSVNYLHKDFASLSKEMYGLYEDFFFKSGNCKNCELTDFARNVTSILNYKNIHVFKLYHGNSFGESNEFAFIDYNTSEILVIGRSYAE